MRLALRTVSVLVAGGSLASAWGGLGLQVIDEHTPPDETLQLERSEVTQHLGRHQEMLELMGTIELDLVSIDVVLTDAAAGDTSSLVELEAAGIDALLRDSVRRGRAVQQDMQRLVDLANQPPSSSARGNGK